MCTNLNIGNTNLFGLQGTSKGASLSLFSLIEEKLKRSQFLKRKKIKSKRQPSKTISPVYSTQIISGIYALWFHSPSLLAATTDAELG